MTTELPKDPDPGTDPKDPDVDPKDQDPGTDPDDDSEGGDDWKPPTREAWEKLNRTAKRRDDALRKTQARVAELERSQQKDGDKPLGDDPVVKANAKLVRAEARTALAAAGITDRATQKNILDLLNLSGIEVDDDGPDPDAVADLVDTLREAFGGAKGKGELPKPRTPRVDTRDRGGSSGQPVNPDSARYRRILTGRR